ncbi:MAG TPA: TetR/AcrR family transcriptional regulator [Candidatus Dormibacteraeota bacterium]|jgi:AcrR family transcriptional regulator|nr:TetR/AcrR family transcriptional regulator [Candidatus Dormibacteraeota bacterium]
MSESTTPAPGRPRSDLDATVFTATLRLVHELGYAGATMDRIAAAAGIAKTTIYRRWPSKGVLITECLLHAFAPLPSSPLSPGGPPWLTSTDPRGLWAAAIRWIAAKIGEPGVGAAFAGVFVDGITDPTLRDYLLHRLQDPYRAMVEEALGEPPERVLLFIDIIVGTLLHRMGMTGEPMADADVEALIALIVSAYG